MSLIGNFHFTRKQLQLRTLALLVKDLYRLLPAGMRCAVQFPQVAQRALPRTIGRTHGFHQRPIAMLSAVSNAPMLAKEHPALIMAAENFAAQEARSALHQVFRQVLIRPH